MNAGLELPQIIGVTPNCPSGNCTFSELVNTLGWCSSCSDISNEIHVFNESVPFDGSTVWKTNLSLPSGVHSAEFAGIGGVQSFLTAQFEFPGDVEFLASYLQPMDPSMCKGPNSPSWVCQGAGAASCQLRPCVKTYNTTVNNGRLEETLIRSHNMPVGPENFNSMVNVSCLRPVDKAKLAQGGQNLSSDDLWMVFDPAIQGQEPISNLQPQLNIPQECVYSLLTNSFLSLVNGLRPLLTGSMTPNNAHEDPQSADGQASLQAMYQGGNVSFEIINATMHNLTEAMTSYTREHGDLNWSEAAEGQAWRTDTCVRIEWGWLASPAALTGLTLIFFVTMIVQTRRGEVGYNHNWKSSTLPLLYHGLEQRTRWRQGELAQMDDMKKSAKELHVKLTLTEEGWRLAPVD